MIQRKHHHSVSRCLVTLLAFAICAALALSARAQQVQFVKWKIEATVTDIVDPTGIFPGVRLGDPVHGSLQYDATLTLNPLFSDPPWFQTYTNYSWLPTVSMVLENPRSGTNITFTPDESGYEYTGVEVVDDYEHDDGSLSDWLFAKQPVAAPLGFTGTSPTIAVGMFAPGTTRTDASLPAEIALDDWPLAAMLFLDRFHSDEAGTSIEAEIYSLTPVVVAAGDFNADGLVDAGDLAIWQDDFGVIEYAYGDADADGDADGRDFLVWQRQYTGPVSLATTVVPEPGSGVSLLSVVAAGVWIRRRDDSPVHQLVNADTRRQTTVLAQATSLKKSDLLRHIPGAPETHLCIRYDTRQSIRPQKRASAAWVHQIWHTSIHR